MENNYFKIIICLLSISITTVTSQKALNIFDNFSSEVVRNPFSPSLETLGQSPNGMMISSTPLPTFLTSSEGIGSFNAPKEPAVNGSIVEGRKAQISVSSAGSPVCVTPYGSPARAAASHFVPKGCVVKKSLFVRVESKDTQTKSDEMVLSQGMQVASGGNLMIDNATQTVPSLSEEKKQMSWCLFGCLRV
ncbi:hypothetical protein HYV11_03485 [Candidatus Dependentiae bacterium]|nr:hypothetical protein [Candidatus Dependentiae bacterium]